LKPWYRLLKVIYIISFCALTFYLSAKIYNKIDPSKEIINDETTKISCNSGKTAFAKDIGGEMGINFNLMEIIEADGTLANPENRGLYYRQRICLAYLPLLIFCRQHKIDESWDAMEVYDKTPVNFKIDVHYKTQWLRFLISLTGRILVLIVLFEILRQLGYYIFLGRIYLFGRIIKIKI